MSIKISSIKPTQFTAVGRSDFFRRFQKQFSILLSNSSDEQYLKPGDGYVELTPYSLWMDELFRSRVDSFRFVIGPTGVGKTTLMEQSLGFNFPAQCPAVKEDCLIIPTLCDSSSLASGTVEDFSASVIGAGCDYLEEHFEISASPDEIIQMIKGTKRRLLTRARKRPDERDEETLEGLFETYKRAYYLEVLKVLLNKCSVKSVFVILDDVESLPGWETQSELLYDHCRIYECLRNNPEKNYSVKLLVGCRPNTYRHLRQQPQFNAYPFQPPLVMSEIPRMSRIFEKRFALVTKGLSEQNEKTEDWNSAYQILVSFANELDQNHGSILSSLENNNIRDTLNLFETLLSNRRWLQGGTQANPAFRVYRKQFYSSLIPVIRATGYGEGCRYKDSTDHPVPNVLTNYPDKKTELLPLYFIKNLIEHTSPDGNEGWTYLSLKHLIDDRELIFSDSYSEERIQKAYEFLLKRGLIWPHPDPKYDPYMVALSPRGYQVWELLSQNSVLLEMFREDIFLDDKTFIQEPTHELSVESQLSELFKLFLFLCQAEECNIQASMSVDGIDYYKTTFGNGTICSQLWQGLKRSYHAQHNEKTASSALHEVYKLASDAEMKLNMLIE